MLNTEQYSPQSSAHIDHTAPVFDALPDDFEVESLPSELSPRHNNQLSPAALGQLILQQQQQLNDYNHRVVELERNSASLLSLSQSHNTLLKQLSRRLDDLRFDNSHTISTVIKFKEEVYKTVNEFIEYQNRSMNEVNQFYEFPQAPTNYGYTPDIVNDLKEQAKNTIAEGRQGKKATDTINMEDEDFDIDAIANEIEKELCEVPSIHKSTIKHTATNDGKMLSDCDKRNDFPKEAL